MTVHDQVESAFTIAGIRTRPAFGKFEIYLLPHGRALLRLRAQYRGPYSGMAIADRLFRQVPIRFVHSVTGAFGAGFSKPDKLCAVINISSPNNILGRRFLTKNYKLPP
jgi:hypothetical protein